MNDGGVAEVRKIKDWVQTKTRRSTSESYVYTGHTESTNPTSDAGLDGVDGVIIDAVQKAARK